MNFTWTVEGQERYPVNLRHPRKLRERLEGFKRAPRNGCVSWFASLEDARSNFDDWRGHYNHVRPHRSLGKKPSALFAREAA